MLRLPSALSAPAADLSNQGGASHRTSLVQGLWTFVCIALPIGLERWSESESDAGTSHALRIPDSQQTRVLQDVSDRDQQMIRELLPVLIRKQ